MKFEISKDEYKNGSPKRYRVELSLTGMLGLGTVLVLGLVWVFIFGVLVGRGYQPEKAVPELAKLMPENSRMQQEGDGVIQPEELTFLDKLRDEPQRAAPEKAEAAPASAPEASPEAQQVAPEPEQAAVPAKPEQQPAQAASEAPKAQQVAAAPAAEPAAEPASEQVAAPAPQPAAAESAQEPAAASEAAEQGPELDENGEEIDQTHYAYVYQIASLSEPEAALRFRDKVRKLGLQSEVKVIRGENRYWHRVVVLFQGRPIDTREMKAKLKTLGVDKPLLRSKDPVS